MLLLFFFFKQKTAYEMRISDWSSDVCSSDLRPRHMAYHLAAVRHQDQKAFGQPVGRLIVDDRSHIGGGVGVRMIDDQPVRQIAHLDRKSVVQGKSVS